MRARLTTLAVLSALAGGAGCRVDVDSPPSPPAAGEAAPADDAAVVTAAVRHFAAQDLNVFRGRETKTVILVQQESDGPSGYLSDDQLRGESRQRDWEVPADLRESLRRRNDKAVPLSDWKFGDGIVTADLRAERPEPFRDPLRGHPDAKAYVELWLPGYSKDGKTAVVRFKFGPTTHGASATYLLTKAEGGWTVQKWDFAYYA